MARKRKKNGSRRASRRRASKVYGYDVFEPSEMPNPYRGLAQTPEEWSALFQQTRAYIVSFIRARDPIEVLAVTSAHWNIHGLMQKKARSEDPALPAESDIFLEQADVEVLQALVLMQDGKRKKVPASPSNLTRFWPKLNQHVFAFTKMHRSRSDGFDARDYVIGKTRTYTVYYRNLFVRKDCEEVVGSILKRMDDTSVRELSFRLSDGFDALVGMVNKLQDRGETFRLHTKADWTAETETAAREAIAFFCEVSPPARRAWQIGEKFCTDLASLRWAGLQLSDISYSWSYTVNRDELRKEFGDKIIPFIEKLAIRLGELNPLDPTHIYMNNPIWSRPLIALSDDELLMPIPQLLFGFPFKIFESFIVGNPALEAAYSDARSKFLEDEIARLVSSAMPHAQVYRGVMWQDVESGKGGENDVVAVIGNCIFLFEAKSGRLDEVARRGGLESLVRNFRELFIEPGEQAWRLEQYLNAKGQRAKLWLRATGETITFDLDKPKIVHKFSICIEHFASLTSAKHNLKALGLIQDDSAWAPVLSLGELKLVWRFLDTEISFFHYLTRRATLEELLDFQGDEQDILSIYLTNGLCFHPDKLEGRKVTFSGVDWIVREPKTPRSDRTECVVYGVPLTPYWTMVVQEIYEDVTLRHRFDILQVILNQDPYALAGMEHQIAKRKKSRSARAGQDVVFSRYPIGQRTFVLAFYLSQEALDESEWTERSRNIAFGGASSMFGATDCAVFVKFKESQEYTFDGVSFFRMGSVARPALATD